MWRDSLFDGVEWWGSQELEISEEDDQLSKESISSSLRSISTLTNESSNLSPKASAGEGCQDGIQSMPGRAMQVPKNTASVKEWLCEYPNCGRSFTHRYRLNKHQKYHSKQHWCLEPSCLASRVTFSREQDLFRHQSQHNGRRFYCSHSDCSYAIDGSKDGFTRKDNLKRHLTTQHRHSQQ